MQDPKSLWQQRRQQLGEFINWELKGRLAVRTDGRGDSASLIWKRNDVDQEIHYDKDNRKKKGYTRDNR